MKAQIPRLYADVEFLTEIRPFRNYQNLEVLEKVCDYLKDAFAQAGYESTEQKWLADGEIYKNIIASYQPEKSRRLIVGAHYDVCGDQPGADDNASAVAGLLETARLIAENQPEIDYRIDFVAYSLEEPPFFGSDKMGSYIHAESLRIDQVDVMGMICYEMIGYFSDEPYSQSFPFLELAKLYPSTGNFIIVVGNHEHHEFGDRIFELMRKGSEVGVEKIILPAGSELAGLSDHRNYWEFGYPAVMVNDTSFLRNPNYHMKSDTIDTLDFEKMSMVVDSTYRAIVHLG